MSSVTVTTIPARVPATAYVTSIAPQVADAGTGTTGGPGSFGHVSHTLINAVQLG
jgi:hypothetical protein